MRKHYEKIIRDNDQRVKKALRIQVINENSPYHGGCPEENDLMDAKYTIYRVYDMVGAYSNSGSVYYKDAKLAERIVLALDYVARYQHEDGLFDLIRCNFHSAPDTAFIVKRMLPVLHYLKSAQRDEWQETIYQKMSAIAKKSAYGLLAGGFHTPNHRWAIASNLMECAEFFEEPKFAETAKIYLAEGIDCNEDGEFAEKSAGNYNRINNDAMITMGRCTGDDTFFEYAVRNLRMMLTYIEPDGTIFTANSTRQDNGKRVFPKYYYWEYLTMGVERDIPEFLDFANYIFEVIEENHLTAPDILIHYMNRPELIDFEWEGCGQLTEFERIYSESGIARVRKGDITYTLMKGKSGFLYFSTASLDVAVKIGGCICEHRAFIPETFEKTEDGFLLTQVMKGWYYLPFKEYQGTSDWWKMDNSKREKKMGPDLTIEVRVKEVEKGIEVNVKLHGIERAPFRIELAVLGAYKADSDSFSMFGVAGKQLLVKQGDVRVSNGRDAIDIGPAFGANGFIEGIFGSEESDHKSFTMYFTDYTEFDHTFTIRNVTN